MLGLVPYPPGHAPSQRYRLEQWLPYLGRAGVRVELRSYESPELYRLTANAGRIVSKALGHGAATVRRTGLLFGLGRYDAVLLHREAMVLGPAWLEPLIARARPMVFDFDDAIWMRNENPINPLAAWLKFPGKTARIVRRSAAVLAGNAYLADWARRYNRNVHLVPTTVDMAVYDREKVHARSERPTVGWTGSRSTLRYLAVLRPVLEELARRRPYRLLVLCDGDRPAWGGLPLEWRTWASARETEDLLEIDVGLMPQPDEEWAKGKCGMKALQYMALGIPPVASRNGALPEIVRDGEDGLLASDDAEWLSHLEALLDDPERRARLGAAARRTVTERFSAAVHAPRVAAILREVAG